jgi:hypothetical protein
MSSCNPEPSGNESVDSDGSALKPLSELKSQLLLSILAARGTLSSSSGVVGAVDLFHAALDGLQLHAAHICFEDSASAVQFVRCHQVSAHHSETVAEVLEALSEKLRVKSAEKVAAKDTSIHSGCKLRSASWALAHNTLVRPTVVTAVAATHARPRAGREPSRKFPASEHTKAYTCSGSALPQLIPAARRQQPASCSGARSGAAVHTKRCGAHAVSNHDVNTSGHSRI